MSAVVGPRWRRTHRRRVFQSVFQTDIDISQITSLQVTTANSSTGANQSFGGHTGSLFDDPLLSSKQQRRHTRHGRGHTLPPMGERPDVYHPTTTSSSRHSTPEQSLQMAAQPPLPSLPTTAANDQEAYDRAWHVVTAHIALPSSATADDSFGNLAAESQQGSRRLEPSSEFLDAFALVINASTLLPGVTQTRDIVAWHLRQVRSHFAQHVVPLLAGCVDDAVGGDDSSWQTGRRGNSYEKHMVTVMSSIRTLEAALRLYIYGLDELLSGFSRLSDGSPQAVKDAELLNTRFRRDIHALVSNSASEGLMRSVKAVLVCLAGTVLGIPSLREPSVGKAQTARPAPPGHDDLRVVAARERLLELVQQLHNVGLAGERFHVLFAEVMDAMMSEFVTGAYAGVWSVPDTRSFSAAMDTISGTTPLSASSPCIRSLNDWVENHFAQLSFQVLACISPDPHGALPVSLGDLKTFQSIALGRLAALRIDELFDIALAWPASRPALEDLRASVTTAARRRHLTDSFSRTLQRRLLHPGCSTLEILQTYISIIRTLHALDHSKVLLSHVEPSLQLYLCQREDAVRVVVSGLLASHEEVRNARKVKEAWRLQNEKARRDGEGDKLDSAQGDLNHSASRETGAVPPRITKLVELAMLLNDPSQTRHNTAALTADEDLDWNDMNWVPDPVDAGANYKRPRSEDVIGTLISALGSQDVFIKEFSAVVAERLLGEPASFDQELRVLELLKRRFGEAALQNCDVMIKDVQDSRRLDTAIWRARSTGQTRQVLSSEMLETIVTAKEEEGGDLEYHARILSRLFWPGLEREHFLLPQVIVEQQKLYEKGYEDLKSGRKLTWLNHLGQARVELELTDRTVTVDCTPVEATVIYAFQEDEGGAGPVRKTVEELYGELQMDDDLITAALRFWVSRGVLLQHRAVAGSQHQYYYTVAETAAAANSPSVPTNNPADGPVSAAGTEAGGEAALANINAGGSSGVGGGGASISAKERERREMYWRYIQGMLTNASPVMSLGQMAMMLKMSVADGFQWSNEELQEFLGEKVAADQMEVVGGKYKLKK